MFQWSLWNMTCDEFAFPKERERRTGAIYFGLVRLLPGWDVHGLPVELKAIQEFSSGTTRSPPLAPEVVRQAANRLATKYMHLQKHQFKKWGILGDWDTNYTTMDYSFESNELLVFQSMVESGLIYRGLRPVYWSPSSKTALAESELEYADRKSHSAYYSYPLRKSSSMKCDIVSIVNTL